MAGRGDVPTRKRGEVLLPPAGPPGSSDPLARGMLSVFLTDLGWFGLAGSGETVVSLTIGHASAEAVRSTFASSLPECDWHPTVRRRLEAFAAGEPCDFDDLELALPPMTPFQQRVVTETRRVAYGRTLTYGELAERAGAPRAARAVGTVMSANRIPIIIPCHRIVASGGGLGGYSAPQGTELKRRLLTMEAEAEGAMARRPR